MARITYDEASWPIIVIKFPDSYSDVEFSDYLTRLGAALARGPRAIILDTRAGQTPTARQRQQLMQFVKGQWAALNRLVGIAFIVDSSLARHALTAVSWAVAKPCRIRLVASMIEARAWLTLHDAPVSGLAAR